MIYCNCKMMIVFHEFHKFLRVTGRRDPPSNLFNEDKCYRWTKAILSSLIFHLSWLAALDFQTWARKTFMEKRKQRQKNGMGGYQSCLHSFFLILFLTLSKYGRNEISSNWLSLVWLLTCVHVSRWRPSTNNTLL